MVGDLALRVDDGEMFFLDEIELQELILAEIPMEATHHILILELCVGGVVVDDGEERELS